MRLIIVALPLLLFVLLAADRASGGTAVPDFSPHGTQPGLAYALEGASNCSTCHSGGSHFPATSWSGSMMANAARDPLFWAALDVANADAESIGAAGVGEYCLRCHTPGGWFAGRAGKALDGSADGGANGCKLQGQPHYGDSQGNDFRGVDCHFCHRVREHGTDPLAASAPLPNGAVWLDDGDCDGRGEPCRAGPYDYEGADAGAEPPHAWEASHFLGSAQMCGSCHDVSSPVLADGPLRTLVDASGTDTGLPFPVERTFGEWQASDFSRLLFRDGAEDEALMAARGVPTRPQDCAGCHMPQAQPDPLSPDAPLLACYFGPDRAGELPVHEFVGGNHWMPQVLAGEFAGLGRDNAFAWTQARAEDMLSQRSARVQATAQRLADDTLQVDVEVTNLAGHKLPTGYGEGRRMWLSVEVRDANGALVWRNGWWDSSDGTLHRDAQTRVYEVLQGIWDPVAGACRTQDAQGREQFHFVLNNCVAKDNRIPPAGFTGGGDPELRPVGHAFAAAADGVLANRDVASYQVPLPVDVAWPLQVEATLQFQVASREYIEFLRDQAQERGFASENLLCAGDRAPFADGVGAQDQTRGAWMHELWETYGRSAPASMGSASVGVSP